MFKSNPSSVHQVVRKGEGFECCECELVATRSILTTRSKTETSGGIVYYCDDHYEAECQREQTLKAVPTL